MADHNIQVFLISGFLGAGKTTFLNRMLKQTPQDWRLMILMNEFGEEGIDGTLVDDPELEMVEVNKGSIFCACVKGDFIKALYRIAFTVKPDVLLIEATGVANPSDLNKDLVHPMFKGTYHMEEKFCLVDAENFLDQYEVFTAVEKQIESSNRFIINKIDLVGEEILGKIKEIINQHNPGAAFVETTYADVDLTELLGRPFSPVATQESETVPLLNETQLDDMIDDILSDQASQLSPPDQLMSMVCMWNGGSLDEFKAVAANIPKDVVRGKGFVFDNGQIYLYNHVGKTHTVVPYEGRNPGREGVNRIVFIRSRFEQDDIRSLFQDAGIQLT